MSESSSRFSMSGSGDNGRNKDLYGGFFAVSLIGQSCCFGGAFNSGNGVHMIGILVDLRMFCYIKNV